jgi:hypothetical protein
MRHQQLERHSLEWLFPVRGRWLTYLLVGLPVGGLMLILPWPNLLLAPAGALLAVGWWWLWRGLVDPTRAPRFKSIDVGTGVLVVSESGGPVPEGLRSELTLWQEAGMEALYRLSRERNSP